VVPNRKQLIIIPGSCSAQSNWFDQIDFFESAGYEVRFLALDAHKYKTLIECSTALFLKLKYALQTRVEPDADDITEEGNIESMFEDIDDIGRPRSETVILAHSMGAMLLLKILSESKYYRNENLETFTKLEQSKLMFIQVPLHVNRPLLPVLNAVQYLLYPFFFFYHLTTFNFVEKMLLATKRFLRIILKPFRDNALKYIAVPIFNCLDLLLNIMLMNNAFLGSKPQEFANLINYYKQWDEFSLEGFFADKEEAAFSREIMKRAESTLSRFDTRATKNYHFTTGSTDIFCNAALVKNLANELGANILELDYGFHNPQHVFWTQEKLHKEIMR
jgi:pimeloyl-ACP methyl ester carboxylesterase